MATLTVATLVDTHSSVGRYEANPVLRGRPYGQFSPGRGIALKAAGTGGLILLETALLKRLPSRNLHRPFAITNFATAGVLGGTAARNYRIPPARLTAADR